MNDNFLNEGRQEPRAEFTRSLRDRLRALESRESSPRPVRARLSAAAAAFASVLVIVGLFSIPAVRASAQAFLDLFRVRNFAAVTVDAQRMELLRGQQFDVESVLGKPERILDPGPARAFPNAQEAALATGYTLRQAVGMSSALRADTTWVRGESRTRLRIDGPRMRGLLASLAIDDIQLPPAIDGAEVNVHLMPVARTTYRREGGHEITLIQSPSPEFSLPVGIEMAQLGEIGLRVAGLSPAEARRMSRSIDWHSTLLVPVPGGASSFREVEVRGHKGLLVALDERGGGMRRRLQGEHTQLLWSDGDRVFALMGRNVSDVELLQMANQVQ